MSLILLNTLPKSGSVYIRNSLLSITGSEHLSVSNGYAFNDFFSVNQILNATSSNNIYLSQEHVMPYDFNLDVIRFFKLKSVVHVRDPRQALLSWMHHINRYTGGNPLSHHNLFVRPLIKENYFSLNFSDQIDYQIEKYLPQCIKFIDSWFSFAKKNKNILLTEYMQLKNEQKLFDEILNFYNLNNINIPDKIELGSSIDDTHIRLGESDEFLRVFNRRQRRIAYRMIPSYLFKLFDWPRENFFSFFNKK